MILTFLCTSQGPILELYQELGVTTANSARYSEMLHDKQKSAIGVNAEDNCNKVLCCCITTPTLFKHSSSCTSRCYNIHHSAMILPRRAKMMWLLFTYLRVHFWVSFLQRGFFTYLLRLQFAAWQCCLIMKQIIISRCCVSQHSGYNC